MDLSKDSLFNPDHPFETPCRWSGSVTRCKDTEYFQIVTLVSLGISCILTPSVVYLLALSKIRGTMWFQPWKWTPANIYYGCNGLTGISFGLYDIIIYVDVPGDYWPRHFLFAFSFAIFLSGIVPFLHTLTAPAALSLSCDGGRAEETKVPLTHRIVQSLPIMILLALLIATVRGACMDRSLDLVVDILTVFCLGLYCVSTLLIAYTCCYHGSRFFSLLHARILTVEGGPASRSSKNEDRFAVSPRPPQSRAYRSFGRSISTMHLNAQKDEDPEVPISTTAGKSLTAIEARAALRKITYVNVLMFLVAAGGCVFTFLMAIMPSKIFTILVLSKITYTFLQAGIPALLTMIVVANIITEHRRRRSFHDYHNTPDISLVEQVRTIHHTIMLSEIAREDEERPHPTEVGIASSHLQTRTFLNDQTYV